MALVDFCDTQQGPRNVFSELGTYSLVLYHFIKTFETKQTALTQLIKKQQRREAHDVAHQIPMSLHQHDISLAKCLMRHVEHRFTEALKEITTYLEREKYPSAKSS
ncbi:hypothetical protein [Algicola sagamiensis]|uniref:hypothetical protein n=1 Tax=Algicola sagamiensis TaxID=163869 RepID=UPI00035F1124|nr:hypothetical protein [Algicola sagamiensis]